MKRNEKFTAGNRRYDRMRSDLNRLVENVPEAPLPVYNRCSDYSYYYNYTELVKMMKSNHVSYEKGRMRIYSEY